MLAALSFHELLQAFGLSCVAVLIFILLVKRGYLWIHSLRHGRVDPAGTNAPGRVDPTDANATGRWRAARNLGKAALGAVGFCLTALAVLDLTDAWRFIWKPNNVLDLNKAFFPDLNGEWEGKVLSNSTVPPRTAPQPTRAECPEFGSDNTTKLGCNKVKVSIVMTLFETDVKLILDDEVSHAKGVSLQRRRQLFDPQIRYHFEVGAAGAQPYNGAAVVTVDVGAKTVLHGFYWTNRDWRDGKNTAGRIWLTRVGP